jgi:hypothetical protein
MKEAMMPSKELDKIFAEIARELAQILHDRAGWLVSERDLYTFLRTAISTVSADQVAGLRAQGVPVSKGGVHDFVRILAEIILSSPCDCPRCREALVDDVQPLLASPSRLQ